MVAVRSFTFLYIYGCTFLIWQAPIPSSQFEFHNVRLKEAPKQAWMHR